MWSRLHTCGDGLHVNFQLSWGSLDNFLDGCLRFTCDGEGGMTHYSRFGVLGVGTVGGKQVDGEATVIAEAFEAAAFPFLFGELAIHLMPRFMWLAMVALDAAVGLLPNFAGAEEEADCLFQAEGVVFLPWHSQ